MSTRRFITIATLLVVFALSLSGCGLARIPGEWADNLDAGEQRTRAQAEQALSLGRQAELEGEASLEQARGERVYKENLGKAALESAKAERVASEGIRSYFVNLGAAERDRAAADKAWKVAVANLTNASALLVLGIALIAIIPGFIFWYWALSAWYRKNKIREKIERAARTARQHGEPALRQGAAAARNAAQRRGLLVLLLIVGASLLWQQPVAAEPTCVRLPDGRVALQTYLIPNDGGSYTVGWSLEGEKGEFLTNPPFFANGTFVDCPTSPSTAQLEQKGGFPGFPEPPFAPASYRERNSLTR